MEREGRVKSSKHSSCSKADVDSKPNAKEVIHNMQKPIEVNINLPSTLNIPKTSYSNYPAIKCVDYIPPPINSAPIINTDYTKPVNNEYNKPIDNSIEKIPYFDYNIGNNEIINKNAKRIPAMKYTDFPIEKKESEKKSENNNKSDFDEIKKIIGDINKVYKQKITVECRH